MKEFIETSLPIVKTIVLALLTLIIGLILIKWITKRLNLRLPKSKIDNTLQPFIVSLVNIGLKILLIIVIVGVLGIDTSSIVALIASAGFAVGLAFQGSLANFSGGILLLIVKPFRAGDFIESEGIMGTVRAVKILYTEILTINNQIVFIPNGKLSNASITNYSAMDTRRFEIKIGVGYDCDINNVKSLLKGILNEHPNILKDPAPFVRLTEHGDSALIFSIRGWTNLPVFWDTYFDILETLKTKFDENDISIPYPQMDIHTNNLSNNEAKK